MPETCQEHLVCTYTDDGVRLDGAMITPTLPAASSVPIIWIHGGGNNFHEPLYLRVGRALAARGFLFVTGNTRGHDYGAWCARNDGTSFLGGTAWERLEEAPSDVAAWASFAAARGHGRIALAGHSLGALKVIGYQAARADGRVAGVAVISPPLRPEWDTRRHPDLLTRAMQLVTNGEPEALLPGPWLPLSAQTFLSTHQFDLDHFGRVRPEPPISSVRCPVLAVVGTKEPAIARPDDLEVLEANAASSALDLVVVQGADHAYQNYEGDLARVVGNWATGLV